MVTINGKKFYEFPTCCYSCPFFLPWGDYTEKGTCTLLSITKNKYSNLSKRCSGIFDKARTYPDGAELVLVAK